MTFPSVFRALVNRCFLACTLLAVCSQALVGAGNFPSAADGFDPNVNGNVFALAQQADGKIIVGGLFGSLSPNGGAEQGRNNLARLGPDGSLDASFTPGTDAQVNAVVVQSDGKIVIGGSFTTVNGVARNRIARLNTDGSVDTSFNPDASASVNALALYSDGKILVGGAFRTIGGAARNRVARLTANGTADSFDPNAGNVVNAIAVQVDGKIVIGGGFTTLQPNGAASPTSRSRAARLYSDGAIDPAFDPAPNNLVSAIGIQLDGKIVLGGSFITVQPSGAESATTRNHIARFLADGRLDTLFDANASANVTAIAFQADSKILIGGTFLTLQPSNATSYSRAYFARLNVDGSVDSNFIPGANNVVSAIAVQSDGSLVVGGYFTQLLSGSTSAIATNRNHLARVSPGGTLDIAFDPGARGAVLVQAVQPNGQILIAGTFSSVGGVTRNGIARLSASGSLDANFNPNSNGRIDTMVVQGDGKILVAGTFTRIAGVDRGIIARLNPDGSLDAAFNPSPSSTVSALAVQGDGKILIGGNFSTLQPNGATTATARTSLARLNSDGTLDTAFDPGPNSSVSAMVVQADGKIVVAGQFSVFFPNAGNAGVSRNYVARLNADGSIDGNYIPNPNGAPTAMALQSDGKIVMGGVFTALLPNGDTTQTTRGHLVRITTDGKVDASFDPNINSVSSTVNSIAIQASDQKILVGGNFHTLLPAGVTDNVTRNYLVRLATNGSVEAEFNPNPNSVVRSVVAQPDGSILVAGSFSTLQPEFATTGTPRLHVVKLAAAGAIDSSFNPSAGGQVGGQVNALATQTNGRFIIAGSLGETGGATGSNLARFNADSTVDGAFAPDANGPINALAIRPNSEAVPTQAGGFAFLNADGSFRPGFTVSANVHLVGQVFAVAVQSDKKIILGGAFVNTTGATGNNLIRLLPDGTLDTSYNPSPDSTVFSLALQPDNSLLVGGSFTTIAGAARNRIAQLDGGGTATNFDPNASSTVSAIVLQSDGKIVIGGQFTTLQPNGATTTTARNCMARLNADGTVDANYNPTPNSQVLGLAVQGDGKIVAVGSFASVAPNGATTFTVRNNVARFNADGTLDSGFDPNANSAVQAVAILPDGKVLLVGAFTTVGGWETPYINRVLPSGANDPDFYVNPNGSISTLSVQADGKVIIGGNFSTINGVPRNRVARLNADNTLDTTFNPNADGVVSTVLFQPDGSMLLGGAFTSLRPLGSIYVGGSFTTIGNASVSNLVVLNDDGSASTNFNPAPNGAVLALAMQSDGRALVSGDFTSLFGTTRNRLARLSADATLDTTFNPNANGSVSALALQADGKAIVGGNFTTLGGVARSRVARVGTDGLVDSFNPGADGQVEVLAVQADGRVVLGGTFATVGGTGRRNLARVNTDGSLDGTFNPNPDGAVKSVVVQANGQLIVGGSFATIGGAARASLARLNTDGSLDSTFDPGTDGTVLALALATDGKLLVGGTFSSISGVPRGRFARLAATLGASQSLSANSSNTVLTWSRNGSSPELSGVIFEQSSDATNWSALGTGSRVGASASWQLSGTALPTASYYYIRARGVVNSTQHSSSGLVDSVRWITPGPAFTSPALIGASVGSSFYYAVSSSTGAATYSASGLPAGLSFDPATGIISGVPTQTGTFVVSISATNAGGSSASTVTIMVGSGGGSTVSSRLVSLSGRGPVSVDSPLLAGFVVSGTDAKTILFRGVGPSLRSFGLQGVLERPELRLYNSSGQLLLTGGSWDGKPAFSALFAAVGAFPLVANSTDAVMVATLPPGVYTFQVLDPSGAGGVALAEIYDVTSGAAPRLVNISARGTVNTDEGVLIGGLVITGTGNKRILVRAAGPSLTQFGVSSALADPTISVYSSQTQVLASNDNWGTPVTVNTSFPGTSAAEITAASASVGAFPFPSGSSDSAIVLTLAPGSYTIQVNGVGKTTGVALVEVYELP